METRLIVCGYIVGSLLGLCGALLLVIRTILRKQNGRDLSPHDQEMIEGMRADLDGLQAAMRTLSDGHFRRARGVPPET